MGDFRKLEVWKKAKALAVDIYRHSETDAIAKDFRFRDQLRSAAVSIASNIAEGDELDTNKQSIKHFYIAKGSCAEVSSLCEIAGEIGYFDDTLIQRWLGDCRHISAMIGKLIAARKSSPQKPSSTKS